MLLQVKYEYSKIKVTKFVEQNPSWEAGTSSGSHEFPRILWNQNVHYPVYKDT